MPRIEPLDTVLKILTLKQKVGQLFMPAAFINDTEAEIQKLERLISDYGIGSICFFHSRASAATNFEGKKTVVHNEKSYERLLYLIERYQKAAEIPLLIAIDAEWGLAMRIENTPQYPYAITLGAMQNRKDLVFEVGQGIANDCQEAGIHWNLSPVVDINLNPQNPVIGYRSFGANRDVVTQYGRAYLKGMQSQGILNSIKHFPGHGDTATDSHLGLPIIDKTKEELQKNELHPFLQLMDANLDAVMVGHLAIPALSSGKKISASLSKEIMTDFLRGELGWSGVIISDALNMHAISKDFTIHGELEYTAFEAGNDVLCFADNSKEGIKMISEKCDENRINSSFNRFWNLKEKAYNFSGPIANHDSIPFEPLMNKLANESLTLLWGTEEKIKEFRDIGYSVKVVGKKIDSFPTNLSPNGHTENVLLSLTPKQVKPKSNFRLSEEELKNIRETLQKKNTVLYVFGNPFVLNLLPWKKAQAVVVVYQDFIPFQRNASEHFLGKVKAKGKLPVTLRQELS